MPYKTDFLKVIITFISCEPEDRFVGIKLGSEIAYNDVSMPIRISPRRLYSVLYAYDSNIFYSELRY